MKFAVSMIGMRRPQASAIALQTMLRHAEDCLFFVTANGCKETATLFRAIAVSHPNVTVTENTANEGFQKPHAAQFLAAAKAGCEYCLIANDDISVPPGFLEKLAEPMERDPQVAITGPEGNCTHLSNDFHGTGGKGEPEYIEMSCGMIRIDAMRQLRAQLWCPGLRFVYSEDSSLGLFVREKGYTLKTVPMHIEHLRSVTVNGDPETKKLCEQAQAENHATNQKRWSYYITRRRFDFPILLKRSYAIGDVLLMTPIIRAIAQSNPLSPIHIQTDSPEIFAGNPYVASAAKVLEPMKDAMMIDLDGAYEKLTMTHIVHGYEQEVRKHLPGLGKVELRTEMFPSDEDLKWGLETRERLTDNNPKIKLALIGSDETTWLGKNARPSLFEEVRANLRHQGWRTATVGSKRGEIKTTIQQLAALCSHSHLFVGLDSFPMHAAQSVGCPTVGIFGVTRSRFVSTQGSKFAAAESSEKIPSSGLRHRLTDIKHTQDGVDAMASISTGDVMAAIERLEV